MSPHPPTGDRLRCTREGVRLKKGGKLPEAVPPTGIPAPAPPSGISAPTPPSGIPAPAPPSDIPAPAVGDRKIPEGGGMLRDAADLFSHRIRVDGYTAHLEKALVCGCGHAVLLYEIVPRQPRYVYVISNA